MKKKILITFSVILIALFIVYNMGFQIGNFKIGKQYDEIQTSEKYDIENSNFSKDYMQKGQVSIINLWASWCEPCVEELPIFEKLKKDFPNCKFAMLSIDKNEDDLKKDIEKFKISNDVTLQNRSYRKAIRNFLEKRDSKSLFSTEIVPVTYFIKNGKVLKKTEGSVDYNEAKTIIASLNKE